MKLAEAAVLAVLSSRNTKLSEKDIASLLTGAGMASKEIQAAIESLVASGFLRREKLTVFPTTAGLGALLDFQTTLEKALDKSPTTAGQESCPSIPWLTKIETHWIEALSFNYEVDPSALKQLIPDPLQPEIHKGSAWVQVLVSSLRDLRPQGLMPLFGVCFYQVSYRAAVTYGNRRGGYFVRSETNHELMRTVGNRLAEFKFHRFGLATIVLMREKENLIVGVHPEAAAPGGKIVGIVDTTPLLHPPQGSVWNSLEELYEPLIECYDAFGVDSENAHLYTLTIDRDPWDVRFVSPKNIFCEFFEAPMFKTNARLDSILHLEKCRYRWRPLRREAFV